MREGIHPAYQEVVFRDAASGATFKTRSTMSSAQTVEWEDGKTYPLVIVDISAASHPFWTGNQRVLDTAGRVERFRLRYGGQERPTRMKRRRGPAWSPAHYTEHDPRRAPDAGLAFAQAR